MNPTSAITLSSDALQVSVLPRGATLAAVRFLPDGRNLVLGFANPTDHFDIPVYAGALVGPVANRITGGVVEVDGQRYQMPRNENHQTCLHSGPDGLHTADWRVQAQSPSAVTLGLTLADGDHGLPGQRQISARYEATGRCLRLEITAQTDRATPMNIAAHPYWNLDAAPHIAGHKLQIAAARYLPTDAANLPTGEIAEVTGTPFDFRTLRTVPLDPTLDLSFCLANANRPSPQHAACLIGAEGTRLEIATTAPGLQVYGGAFLPDVPGALDDGRALGPFGGIALEPQGWPDAPHHPGFAQITLQPGTIWRQVTEYRLSPPE